MKLERNFSRMRFEEKMPYEDSDVEIIKDILKIFYFYSQLYSQHVIISSVGNKSWVKEHTNGY